MFDKNIADYTFIDIVMLCKCSKSNGTWLDESKKEITNW